MQDEGQPERGSIDWQKAKAFAIWSWGLLRSLAIVLWGWLVAIVVYVLSLIRSALRALLPTSVVLWASGVAGSRLDDVIHQEERQEFISQGSVVFLTASFAFLAAFYFFSLVFPARAEIWGGIVHPMALAFSIIWAGSIFFVDRMMLQTMLGREDKKFLLGFFRVSLAIVVGIVIAHPLKLQLLRDDLAAIYDLERQAFFRQEAVEINQALEGLEAREPTEEERLALRVLQLDRFIQRAEQEILRYQTLAAEARAAENGFEEPEDVRLPLASGTIKINRAGNAVACTERPDTVSPSISRLTSGYQLLRIDNRRYLLSNESGLQEAEDVLIRLELGQRYTPENRPNPEISESPANCVLFDWVKNQWDRALSDAKGDRERVVFSPELEARVGSRLAYIVRQSAAAEARSECIPFMATFTIAEQVDIERRARLEQAVSSDERRKLECALLYQPFSFLHQTELLFANAKLFGGRTSSGAQGNTSTQDAPISVVQEEEHNRQNRQRTIALMSYGLTLLIVFVETLPVAFKLMSKPGPYELQVRRERAVARAEATGKLDFVLSRQERAKIAKKEYQAWLEEELVRDSAVGFRELRREFMSRRAALGLRQAEGEDLANQISNLEEQYDRTVDMLRLHLDEFQNETFRKPD